MKKGWKCMYKFKFMISFSGLLKEQLRNMDANSLQPDFVSPSTASLRAFLAALCLRPASFLFALNLSSAS